MDRFISVRKNATETYAIIIEAPAWINEKIALCLIQFYCNFWKCWAIVLLKSNCEKWLKMFMHHALWNPLVTNVLITPVEWTVTFHYIDLLGIRHSLLCSFLAMAVKESLLFGLQPGILSYINNFLVAGPPLNLMWCHNSLISCRWADLLRICNSFFHLDCSYSVRVKNN